MKGLRSSAATSVTFVANPFARMDYLKKDNMLLNDTGDHQGEEEVPPGAGL